MPTILFSVVSARFSASNFANSYPPSTCDSHAPPDTSPSAKGRKGRPVTVAAVAQSQASRWKPVTFFERLSRAAGARIVTPHVRPFRELRNHGVSGRAINYDS